jgi:hypothetical protein
MKKTVLILLGIFALPCFAGDDAVASKDEVSELKAYCMESADEEQVPAAALSAYLLKCVNDELASEGFQAVSSIE